MRSEKLFAVAAGFLGLSTVACGAFGAHFLKERLSPEMAAVFETGARYHLAHAIALLGVAWAAERYPHALTKAVGWFFITGTVIFSGSLYLLAMTGIKLFGALTPIGGLCLLSGWFCLSTGVFLAEPLKAGQARGS